MGLAWWLNRGRWSLAPSARLAFGNLRREATLVGSTIIETPTGGSATYNSGLLVLDSNRGSFSRDQFVFIPEAAIRIAYDLTPKMQITAGYSVLMIPETWRPGKLD